MRVSKKKIAGPKAAKQSRPALRVIRTSADSSGPAIRWSKVMTAQTRIAEGYYDRDDVRDLLLGEVMKELTNH